MNPMVTLGHRLIIAHRGASEEAPENTLAAFRLAVEQGADALELDVHLAGDGVPVVIHDPTLERTTDATGRVDRRSSTELRAVDAGARFAPPRAVGRSGSRGGGVPTLDDVLAALPDVPLLIEIKTPAAAPAVRRVLLAHNAAARCVVASFDAKAVREFRAAPFLSGPSRREVAALLVRSYLRFPKGAVPYRAVAVPRRWRGIPVATPRLVATARRMGCPVHVWTVNDPSVARSLWGCGVTGIITNVPGVMRELRDSLAT